MKPANWQSQLNDQIDLLGHRNWILVVDKAFPLQRSAGMNYINTNNPLESVLSIVVDALNKSSHINPIYYKDLELDYLDDGFADGVDNLKSEINTILQHANLNNILHEKIFEKLDKASKLFNVLVLKTECTIPYTSIFIELDCAYWSPQKEIVLRDKMK